MEAFTYVNGSLEVGHYTQWLYNEHDYNTHSVIQHSFMHFMSFQNALVSVYANQVTITDSILDNTNCMEKWCGQLFLSLHSIGNIHNITI